MKIQPEAKLMEEIEKNPQISIRERTSTDNYVLHKQMQHKEVVLIDQAGIEDNRQKQLSMEYRRTKRREEDGPQEEVTEKEEPKKPDKQATTRRETPQMQLLPAPNYAVPTENQQPGGYAVTPDRYRAFQQISEDSQSPEVQKRKKGINSADILSGVRPIAPANKVCQEVAEYRPLVFKNSNLAKKVMDVIFGHETRGKIAG